MAPKLFFFLALAFSSSLAFGQNVDGQVRTAPRKAYAKRIYRRRIEAQFSNQLELGYQYAALTDPATPSIQPYYNRAYAEDHLEYKIDNLNTGAQWSFNGGVRGIFQRAAQEGAAQDSEASVRDLSVSWAQNWWNFVLGFQEIPWGETFGVYIADLVNPRDLRDPLLNDLAWMRLPVFAFNEQITTDLVNMQFIYTPFPRDPLVNLSQYGLTGTTLPSFAVSTNPQDGEFGGKLNHTFSWGSDLSLMYLQHWNRDPVYHLDPSQPGTVFVPERHKLNSYIASLSQTAGDFVFRVDAVYHDKQPVMDPSLLFVTETQQLQIVGGIDYSWPENGSAGFQYHVDQTLYFSTLNWVSAKLTKTLVARRLEAEIFVFMGINNLDFWMQPSVRWTPPGPFTFSVKWDDVQASNSVNLFDVNQGILPLVAHQDRILATVSAKF